MLKILLDHWEPIVQIVVLVVSLMAFYFRMKYEVREFESALVQFKSSATEHWTRQDAEFDKLDAEFQAHLNDALPHQSCPAHNQAIADISPRLDRIQEDITHLRDDLGNFKTTIIGHLSKSTR